jgi:CheY-like chemotaxis protein
VNDPAIASGPLVLVADDDPALRSLFQRALERSGLRVVLATNGREALELLETHDIRVCLFDLNMPNLDGLTTDFEPCR